MDKELEPFRLFWMEDPTPAENQAAFRLIRQHTTTPVAVGEVLDEKLAATYPYRRAFPPVNRLEDGTPHDW